MTFFIRHSNNPQADLDRGFSFIGYQLFSSFESALTQLIDYTDDAEMERLLRWHHVDDDLFTLDKSWYADEYGYRIGQDNTTGKFGYRRSGLCAYASFDTLEDAMEALHEGGYDHAAGGEFTEFVVIFEGVQTFDQILDGMDDGISFRPSRIAYVKRRL